MLCEIAYRVFSVYLLWSVAAQYEDDEYFPPPSPTGHLKVERHSEIAAEGIDFASDAEPDEDDDCFSAAIQETKYDPQKEDFCSGRQPLLSSGRFMHKCLQLQF